MTSTERPGELSADELQAYLRQLREAEAGEIVVQAYTMLGTGAEVKLGRPDARLLIDAMSGLAQAVGVALGEELAAGMRNGVIQLQMAQVEAERQAAGGGQAEAAAGGAPQPGAPPPGAAPPPGGRPQPGGAAGAGGRPGGPPGAGQRPGAAQDQRMTDRLWIPGRGQGPPPKR